MPSPKCPYCEKNVDYLNVSVKTIKDYTVAKNGDEVQWEWSREGDVKSYEASCPECGEYIPVSDKYDIEAFFEDEVEE
jgi:endogenous inhibitor of DNA gyrase (YacG/DUF329 family)